MKAFRIYTQHGCPFCELALSLLKTAVPPEEVEHITIEDDPIILSGITALRGRLEWPMIISNVGEKKELIPGNHLEALSVAITRYLNLHRS